MSSPGTSQTLLQLLPAIYGEDPLLKRYLAPFEELFADLERRVDAIPSLFDPLLAGEEFLPWLSAWVGFTLRADLDVDTQRNFLARIIPLYRRRGTRENLKELLKIFTGGYPTIAETSEEFQLGVHATIGMDTFLGGGPAHYFRVTVALKKAEPEQLLRQLAIARALIELEKPAHTYYDLDVVFPTMQIGRSSQIGVDTLLGTGTN